MAGSSLFRRTSVSEAEKKRLRLAKELVARDTALKACRSFTRTLHDVANQIGIEKTCAAVRRFLSSKNKNVNPFGPQLLAALTANSAEETS